MTQGEGRDVVTTEILSFTMRSGGKTHGSMTMPNGALSYRLRGGRFGGGAEETVSATRCLTALIAVELHGGKHRSRPKIAGISFTAFKLEYI